MSEKLDSFRKILLATGQINYLSSAIHGVNEQVRFVPDPKGIHAPSLKAREELLASVAERLVPLMEELGDIMNAHDCICAIDERIAEVPFKILLHGEDDVESTYHIS